jgi:hypothetical protein
LRHVNIGEEMDACITAFVVFMATNVTMRLLAANAHRCMTWRCDACTLSSTRAHDCWRAHMVGDAGGPVADG